MAGVPTIKRDSFHYLWSRHHKPVLYIRSGDRVRFELNDVTSWQINRNSSSSDLARLDASKFYPLAGPVYVEGASPGDALAVSVERIRIDDWGWSAILPGYGLLEEYQTPFLWIWDLSNKRYTRFKSGIRIRINPFCGVMGVAPPEDGYFEVMPPGKHGGNMDIKHLTVGSKVILPVWVDGALFSVGDLHAAQGDGEVCVTAIECAGDVTLRFEVIKNANIKTPRFICKGERPPRGGYIATTGISPDLLDAAKNALREMISHLTSEHNLSKEEAYILCSVTADLRIHEIVDKPNWIVGLMLPREIFPKRKQ